MFADAPSLPGPASAPRQALNLRWLAGSLLTGVAGAGLIGLALSLATVDGIVPVPPERALPPHGDGGTGDVAHKGDRLVRDEMIVAAKTAFKAPMSERAGEREVIRVHSYVQIATELPLRAPDVAVPPFDPLRSARIEAPPAQEGDSDPAETAVTLMRSPLAEAPIEGDAPALSEAEVDAMVAETQTLAGGALPAFPAEGLLSRALRPAAVPDEAGPEARFRNIEVRILPENLTEIAETATAGEEAGPRLFEERDLVLAKDQSLADLLKRNGAGPAQLAALMATLSERARTDLSEGQHVRLLIAPENKGEDRPGDGPAHRGIARVTLYGEDGIQEIVAANDRGAFVSVAPPRPGNTAQDDDESGVTLYESLYGTALKNGVPRPIIEEMVMALATSTDLQQRTNAGDRAELFFTEDEDARPELLYVGLRVHDEIYGLYRYRVPGTSEVDYLDPNGRSSQKFLMRRPVAEGRISSPFGMRLHPILGYARPHNGVDWAATRGTPIMATGDGTIVSAGARSGYGNRVEIQHANGYTTAYNHMARIARGIAPGARVRLGQVIGAVGTTGLSTGPHVHYEVAINGRFVDPMKIRLPSARELTGPSLAAFRQAEEQIDALRQKHGGKTVAERT
ncbi:M23 family metallopeptidase [Methylobacterium indicum]|uniref:Peptidase M23 n=1 Tax=Methylobacterium indicum TaxID=1775910 RepID=A0ABR5HGN9_9HYPH|nr:M23 family metallopeptidase [Methylobacterium indicum]KMO17602.1 peptidase M23 [Methylobacterium indicum]KMO25813.1 peptidase M23 [Methylobacterium indicum]